MEESAFQAIYTGVYIVIFIVSLTTALYLFNGISAVAEEAYEYGNKVTDQTVIEPPDPESLKISDSQAISYYMNYIRNDDGSSDDETMAVTFNNSTGIRNDYTTYVNLINILKGKSFNFKVKRSKKFEIY